MSAILLRRRAAVMGYNGKSYAEDYLQINSLGNGNVTITIPAAVDSNYMTSISYSKDRVNWTTTNIDNTDQTITVPVTTNETVFLKGIGTTFSTGTTGGYSKITSTANHDLLGNIMSLLYGDDFIGKSMSASVQNVFRSLFSASTTLINTKHLVLSSARVTGASYSSLFINCTNLETAPKELPATTIDSFGCSYMFKGCSKLKNAPALLTTTLDTYSYYQMFMDCTSLKTAPTELPATTLKAYCYYQMFYNCTELTTAPILPAATLVTNCYAYMFQFCYFLNYVKMLATDISATDCLTNWLRGVSASGTFVKAASMASLPGGASGIPSGWTVEDES